MKRKIIPIGVPLLICSSFLLLVLSPGGCVPRSFIFLRSDGLRYCVISGGLIVYTDGIARCVAVGKLDLGRATSNYFSNV
jgi:hypothetical protein